MIRVTMERRLTSPRISVYLHAAATTKVSWSRILPMISVTSMRMSCTTLLKMLAKVSSVARRKNSRPCCTMADQSNSTASKCDKSSTGVSLEGEMEAKC